MNPLTAPLIQGELLFAFVMSVIWTSLRVGGMFMVAPVIGTRAIPTRVRLIFVLAVSTALAPLLPTPPLAQLDALTVLAVMREMAIGVALGFVLRIAFEAAALAGELVAQGMALAFAQLADPLRGAATSGVVGMWFFIAFVLLFLAFDGHLAMLRLVVESYSALPTSGAGFDAVKLAQGAPLFFGQVLAVGLTIALPVMTAMLVINLAFGVLGRAAPALNPIAVGLPAALATGMLLLAVLIGELQGPVRLLFEAAFTAAGNLLR